MKYGGRIVQTSDGAFSALQSHTKSRDAETRLGDIADAFIENQDKGRNEVKSKLVRTSFFNNIVLSLKAYTQRRRY